MTQTTPSPDGSSPPGQAPPATFLPPETEGPIKVKRLGFFTRSNLSPEPSPEAPADDGPAAAVDPPASSEPPRGEKSSKSGSSRASSLVDPADVVDGIAGTVMFITGQLHELLARDAYDQWAQVYLADDQDAQGIAKPASKILGRHTGEITGGNPDVADGLMIGIAAAFYLVKQLGKLLNAKRARRAGADISEPPPAAEPATAAGN